jgi:uncharacterized protein (DUF4415 family)
VSVSDTKKHSRTDWDKVDAMQDEDVDTSDIPLLDDDFFARATLRMPEKQVSVTVNVDADVLAWFRARGEKLENHINAALRGYVEARKEQR